MNAERHCLPRNPSSRGEHHFLLAGGFPSGHLRSALRTCHPYQKQSIEQVLQAYPKVNIVTTQIDDKLDERGYILPGLGNFGDRYFGTD